MLNKNISTSTMEAQMIIDALNKKSRQSFKYHQKALKKQALYFSPFYRDFIYKIINSGSLEIIHRGGKGYLEPIKRKSTGFKKRQPNKVCTDINSVDTLPHELGHAVDAWFGHNDALTKTVILSNGKTLKEIFNEEFDSKQEEIYQAVMSEYKQIITDNINEKAYDILMKYMPLYNDLRIYEVDPKNDYCVNKRRIHRILYNSGFVEAYYLLYTRQCAKILNNKYSPILDALSSRYNLDGHLLDHHQHLYYELTDDSRPVSELFANLFEAKVTNKHVQFDELKKFLPKSFEGFEELFNLFYERFMANKRFTSVKRKEAINANK